jgi:hypothetical protein
MPKSRSPKPAAQSVPPEEYQEAITELVNALELCLKCDGLSWEAENAADILVKRYKQFCLACEGRSLDWATEHDTDIAIVARKTGNMKA